MYKNNGYRNNSFCLFDTSRKTWKKKKKKEKMKNKHLKDESKGMYVPYM